jgi:hypothetical protein
MYAITSEPQYLADQAHAHWDLSFDNVGDPHQEIPRICNDRGWLTLYASRGDTTFYNEELSGSWSTQRDFFSLAYSLYQSPDGFFIAGALCPHPKISMEQSRDQGRSMFGRR